MEEKRSLIYVDYDKQGKALTIVRNVSEKEWKELLKKEFAKAEIDDEGIYIAEPLWLDWQEISKEDIGKISEENFIKYVNSLIENNRSLMWT